MHSIFQPTSIKRKAEQPLAARKLFLRDVVDQLFGQSSNGFKSGPLKDLFLQQEPERKLIFKEKNDLEMKTQHAEDELMQTPDGLCLNDPGTRLDILKGYSIRLVNGKLEVTNTKTKKKRTIKDDDGRSNFQMTGTEVKIRNHKLYYIYFHGNKGSMSVYGVALIDFETGRSPAGISIDHVKEVQDSGGNKITNYQLMSIPANSAKSHNAENAAQKHAKKGATQSIPIHLKHADGNHGGSKVFKSCQDPAIYTFFNAKLGSIAKSSINRLKTGNLTNVGYDHVDGTRRKIILVGKPMPKKDIQANFVKDHDAKPIPQGMENMSKSLVAKKYTKVLVGKDGAILGLMGDQATFGNVNSRDKYGLVRKYNGTSVHIMVMGVHSTATKSDVIAHEEKNPLTYAAYTCNSSRYVSPLAVPLPHQPSFAEFMEMPVTEQKCIRILYTNKLETLRRATFSENTLESNVSQCAFARLTSLSPEERSARVRDSGDLPDNLAIHKFQCL